MKQYVETDNRIKIKVPSDNDNNKDKPKTESKETVKEVRILMEQTQY